MFGEWCDALSDCQDRDRSLKTTLVPIVSKLSDMRNVNAELEYLIAEPRKRLIMVIFMVGNIPLLMYLLNKEWYGVLMHTVLGQVVLAGTAAAIFYFSGFCSETDPSDRVQEVIPVTVLLFLFGVFLAMGLFFLASSFLRLPTLRTARAMLGTVRQEKKTVKTIEAYLMSAAVYLSKYIHMEAYRRGRLDRILKSGGMNLSPEVYQAYALVKAGAVLLGTIPCVLFVPLLTPVIVILAVLLYFQEMQKADERLKAKRDEIEAQLPRLVATIEQELKSGRNVVGMLERFRMNAGESLSGELDILIADMRSSNYEAALTRFESRINSPMLSDVVRGLIGVLRGDDSAVYFQMLSHDFKQIELQRLKAEAQKIPPKIRVFSFVMLMCFLLTYLTIICYVAIENLGGMF